MGNLLHSCLEVREPIELSFGLMSGVGPGINVLDGGPRASRGRGGLWGFCLHWPIGFDGVFLKQKCILLVREKLTVFHTDNISLESIAYDFMFIYTSILILMLTLTLTLPCPTATFKPVEY